MISDQLYCEVLLDHRVRRGSYKGLRPGEARRIARIMVESIGSKGDWGAMRLTIVGEAGGVYWAVSPEAVVVEGGSVVGLLRARIRGALRVYDSDYAILEVAALVLEDQGLLGDDPVLAVAVASTGESLARALSHALEPPRPRPGRGEGWIVATRVYDPERARRVVHLLSEYWLGRRPPRPAGSPSKCSSCPLRDECPYSKYVPGSLGK
jgi:hypothetical protein